MIDKELIMTVFRGIELLLLTGVVYVLLIIGYKLFVLGATGQMKLNAEAKGVKANISNLSPGAFCFLLGVVLGGYLVSSQLTINKTVKYIYDKPVAMQSSTNVYPSASNSKPSSSPKIVALRPSPMSHKNTSHIQKAGVESLTRNKQPKKSVQMTNPSKNTISKDTYYPLATGGQDEQSTAADLPIVTADSKAPNTLPKVEAPFLREKEESNLIRLIGPPNIRASVTRLSP